MTRNSGQADQRVWGNPEDGKVVVYIDKKAHDAIHRHGAANPKQEVVGILLGNVSEDSTGKYRVDIVGIIKSESAPGTQTQAQFTHQVWLQLVESAQREYPDQKVVGWYHTHPGFGAFLSDDDVNSHRVAFSHPWHVAAVCDPIKSEFCFFGWDGSEIKAIKGFYTYEVPIKEPEPLHRPVRPATALSRIPPFLIPAIILFLASFTLIAVNLPQWVRSSPKPVTTGINVPSDLYPYDMGTIFWYKKTEYVFRLKKDGTGYIEVSKSNGQPKSEFIPMKKGFDRALDEINEFTAVAPSQQDAKSICSLKVHGKVGNEDLVFTADVKKDTRGENIDYVWTQPKQEVPEPTQSTSLILQSNRNWLTANLQEDPMGRVIRIIVDLGKLISGYQSQSGRINILSGESRELPKIIELSLTGSATLPPPSSPLKIEDIQDFDKNGKIHRDGELISFYVANNSASNVQVEIRVRSDKSIWRIATQPKSDSIGAGERKPFAFHVNPSNTDKDTLIFEVKNTATGEIYGQSKEFSRE